MTKDKNAKRVHPAPAYIAENNFGDYITAATKVLRDIYQVIIRNNPENISGGNFTFEVSGAQTWRDILGLPFNREDLVSALLGQRSDRPPRAIRAILQANRPANVSYETANEAISELIDLFKRSRSELSALAAQIFSQPPEASDAQGVLYRAIVPIALAVHEILDLLDQNFPGFGITGLPAGSAIGTVRFTLSADPKIAITKTKRFAIRLLFERIELPDIDIGGTRRRLTGLPLNDITLKIQADIEQPAPSALSRVFDHDVQEGRSFKLALRINPMDRLMTPYDVSNIPRAGGRRQDVEALITATMTRLLGSGLDSLTAALENSLPRKLMRYFTAQSYNAESLLSRVRPKAPNKSSGNPRLDYPAPRIYWKSGRLRLESLSDIPVGQMGRVPLGGLNIGRTSSQAPRVFGSLADAQDEVFNMRAARIPDWPKFPRDWKRPGRARLASNAVGPTMFARHVIRDNSPVKTLKVEPNLTAKVQSLADIALDFQGEITPEKAFAQHPALLVRGLTCEISVKGRRSLVVLDARIRLRPVVLSHGLIENSSPNLRRDLSRSYPANSELSDLIEHVHFRNFVFLHQSYLRSQVEILPSSNIPAGVSQENIEKLCEAWARAIPAIPLIFDPWFLAHPNSLALKSSGDSLSQGEVLPKIEVPNGNFIEAALRQYLLSNGIFTLNGEYLIDMQPLDPTQNIVSLFESVSVRQGWIVLDRQQSIFDALF